MDVEWDVVGFSVGQVGAVSQVEGDVKEIHNFLVDQTVSKYFALVYLLSALATVLQIKNIYIYIYIYIFCKLDVKNIKGISSRKIIQRIWLTNSLIRLLKFQDPNF